MRIPSLATWIGAVVSVASAQSSSTQGIVDLVKRRLPNHVDNFSFSLINSTTGASFSSNSTKLQNDEYTVSTTRNGTVVVQGNSLSALSSGLHRYLADVAHVDIYWYIGSRLHLAPSTLPKLEVPLKGSSIVPWRYHFNTVTFSYTTAFWTWEDWELELDWLALRGVNLPLAWVGQEKIVVEVFREIGLTDAEISSFLSGPAFQAWNRFGNIQGSWGGGELPMSWIDDQFELQKRIVKRMVELGMTPVLPAFTGFVPRAITRALPGVTVVNGSQWGFMPDLFTHVTFLEPFDEHYAPLQKSFISKQIDAYGKVGSIYTLDQYNENDPFQNDTDYLHSVTSSTWKSLKEADPDAVWLMQGWLFFANSTYWTNERVEAYLSGVEVNNDMLILDLFSESQPEWQRTNSFFGKPWIWCQLHNYGGTLGMYGQIENITINPIEALANSSSMVGIGHTSEGQEGNEIVYDLLLDQAWSPKPIETKSYFRNWVSTRYGGSGPVPEELYRAWEILRTTVYNNTHLTSYASPKSIHELAPNITNLVNVTGHHPTNINYSPSVLVKAWQLVYNASEADPSLWDNPSYQYDLVDITRQVMSNAFIPLYLDLVSSYQANAATADLKSQGSVMINLLSALDKVLLTNDNFSLAKWISKAKAWADTTTNTTITAYFEYNARNQVTLWGPDGQITDYASKSWSGLVSSYYIPRWNIFLDYISSTHVASYNTTALTGQLMAFEQSWQHETWGTKADEVFGVVGELPRVLYEVTTAWPSVFNA